MLHFMCVEHLLHFSISFQNVYSMNSQCEGEDTCFNGQRINFLYSSIQLKTINAAQRQTPPSCVLIIHPPRLSSLRQARHWDIFGIIFLMQQ